MARFHYDMVTGANGRLAWTPRKQACGRAPGVTAAVRTRMQEQKGSGAWRHN
jgi:hypothetical protein